MLERCEERWGEDAVLGAGPVFSFILLSCYAGSFFLLLLFLLPPPLCVQLFPFSRLK